MPPIPGDGRRVTKSIMANEGKNRYTIGLDYGSLSCRGVIVNVENGRILAERAMEYPHGVMEALPAGGAPLGEGWYLQDPEDFTRVLAGIVPGLLEESQVPPREIVGIGVDFTASTVIPVDRNFHPLSAQAGLAARPHAWAKMWKHHSAAAQAARLTQICREQGRPYLDWYGGKISPESFWPKVLQVFDEDPRVFDAAHTFVEGADYIASFLAGRPVFSTALAAAKALYSPEAGYPDGDFFSAYHPGLGRLVEAKLLNRHEEGTLCRPGRRAGGLSACAARQLGLVPGIPVTAGHMDAYTPVLGLGVTRPGVMVMVVGTSTGIMTLSRQRHCVQGVTACLRDIYYPGLWGYGSGQAGVGDAFHWFASQCVPEGYAAKARQRGQTLQQYLTHLAEGQAPGDSGLLALDWWNGNRSCLGNSRLSGLFVGLTLKTRPEDMYRALLEATAFGAKRVVQAYREGGVPVDEILICGGAAEKNPLMMQIYADVLDMPLKVSRCLQAPALGAAIYAAAAGEAAGYSGAVEAAHAMGHTEHTLYRPDPANRGVYQALYQDYQALHDYFGKGGNAVMERLYARKHGGRPNSEGEGKRR